METLVSKALMIRLSLQPSPASDASAFNNIRALSTRCAGTTPEPLCRHRREAPNRGHEEGRRHLSQVQRWFPAHGAFDTTRHQRRIPLPYMRSALETFNGSTEIAYRLTDTLL